MTDSWHDWKDMIVFEDMEKCSIHGEERVKMDHQPKATLDKKALLAWLRDKTEALSDGVSHPVDGLMEFIVITTAVSTVEIVAEEIEKGRFDA